MTPPAPADPAGLAASAGSAGPAGSAGSAGPAGSAGSARPAVLAGLPVVWSADCLRHEPAGEVWLGVWENGTEVPERAAVLLDALTAAGARVTAARPHGDADLLAVHDADLVDHLSTVWEQWQ